MINWLNEPCAPELGNDGAESEDGLWPYGRSAIVSRCASRHPLGPEAAHAFSVWGVRMSVRSLGLPGAQDVVLAASKSCVCKTSSSGGTGTQHKAAIVSAASWVRSGRGALRRACLLLETPSLVNCSTARAWTE